MSKLKLSWLSTLLGNEEGSVRPLQAEAICSLAASAKKITIVSAYFDIQFLQRVVAAIPVSRRNSVRVQVFLNAASGKRKQLDSNALRTLQATWSTGKNALGAASVRVVRRQGIFHSKLLVFEKPSSAVVVIGSANSTTAAYSVNEELMLRLDAAAVPEAVREYLGQLDKIAKPLSDVSALPLRSLQAFLREGTLFYKPNTLAQFRFDLHLPPATRAALNQSRLTITGISTRTSGTTYDPVAGLEGIESAGERGRLLLRPEAIQTCYGWWVPEAYRPAVEAKIEVASKKRGAKVANVTRSLKIGIESGHVEKAAKVRFRRLHTLLAVDHLAAGESPTQRIRRFEQHLDRVKAKLDNESWIRRASSAYASAVVPEIWDDQAASDEFIESFFDYVEFTNASKAAPVVVKSLGESAGFPAGASWTEIRDSFAAFLRDRGWSNDLWL